MKLLLLRKELLGLTRDARALLLLLVFGLLFAGVFLHGRERTLDAAHKRTEAEAHARQQWDQQGDRHPHRGAHFGLYVFAPASVLSSFDPGVSRYLGDALWLEPHRRNTLRFSEDEGDFFSSRFGEFSAAFLFANVLPLLIFALTFNAVTHERESGTLRMSLGAGIRLRDLLLSKLVAYAAVPLLALALAFSLVLASSVTNGYDSGLVARSLLLMAALLLYLLIFVVIGLAVSASARTSQQALTILFALWILFVFVVPRAAAGMARAAVALPTAEQFWGAIKHDYENGLAGDGTLAERGKRFDEALLKQYRASTLEQLPVGAYALRRLQRDAYADKVHALHFDRLWARYQQHENIMAAAGLLSPGVALRLLSMKFAGTDTHHRKHFEDAAESYRQYVNTAIDRWDAGHSKGLRSFEEKYAGNTLWQSIRPFHYQPLPAGAALELAAPELAMIVGWLLVASGLLIVAVRRIRP